MPNMIKIAGRVLEEVSLLDTRIRVSEPVVLAWSRCFEGQDVFLEEAMDAVHRHYQKNNPYPIMPGDVISHCASCPPWSSAQHASAFLDTWAQYPYSTTIADYTGMQAAPLTAPDGLSSDEARKWLIARIAKWVNENRDALIAALIERKHKPVAE